MSFIYDIAIAAIIAITLYFAVKRGFVKTILGATGVILALILAMMFNGALSSFLAKGPVGNSIRGTVDSFVDARITEDSYGDMLDSEDDKKSALERLLITFGSENKYETVKQDYEQWKQSGLETVRDKIKETIREPAVNFCCGIIAFLILFVLIRLLFKLAEIVLGKVTKLPVIKQADKLLGVVAGVVKAVFRVYLFCIIVRLALPLAAKFGWTLLANSDPSQSVLYGLFNNFNFISKLI